MTYIYNRTVLYLGSVFSHYLITLCACYFTYVYDKKYFGLGKMVTLYKANTRSAFTLRSWDEKAGHTIASVQHPVTFFDGE